MTTTDAPTQTTAIANKEETAITTVRKALENMQGQFAMTLPKHITPERMVRVALTAIKQTPKLLNCDRQSLYSAVMRAAQLGLEPDGILGQAYLIPYGNQVQFIPGYKGLIDLARRSGEVASIIAKEVREKDDFKIQWHITPPFIHEQAKKGDRGEVIGFWAMAQFKDGGFHWDYLTIDEVIAIRNQSSGWQSAVKYKKTADSPWEKHFVEMGKKTAIRRIAKYLPMSVQKAAVVEDLIDAGKRFTVDELGDVTIDAEVIDQGADDTAAGAKPSKLDAFAGETQSPPPAPVVLEPKLIPVGKMPDDETIADWGAWAGVFVAHVKGAADRESLNKLLKLNKVPLSNFEKAMPEKFSVTMGFWDARSAELEPAQASEAGAA